MSTGSDYHRNWEFGKRWWYTASVKSFVLLQLAAVHSVLSRFDMISHVSGVKHHIARCIIVSTRKMTFRAFPSWERASGPAPNTTRLLQ